MLKTHTTTEGDKMLICEMSNEHLLNTIRGKLHRVNALLHNRQISQHQNPALNALYQREDNLTPEMAAKQVTSIMEGAYPYLAEALMRQEVADEIRPSIRVALGRAGEQGEGIRQISAPETQA